MTVLTSAHVFWQIAKLEKEKAELEAKLVNSTKAHQETVSFCGG